MSLTPEASLQDGLLDVVIVPKINKLKILFLGFCMLINKLELFKELAYYQTSQLSVLRKQGTFFESQIDGELLKIIDQRLSIGIKKESLLVLT